jgi:phosphoglycolate phosphatase-like HAD superfamily hydrolase
MGEPPIVLVFDIDGTLLQSVHAHQTALLDAYSALGLEIGERSLSEFPDHTDSAIFDLLVAEARGRHASASELLELDLTLAAEYRRRVLESPPAEIAGARILLQRLHGDPRFRVAFATGSMRAVATQKLSQLDVNASAAVLVTASEFLTREEIVLAAIDHATAADEPELQAISIGDGVWDERTALKLGLPFVAVESGTHRFSDGPIHVAGDLISLTPNALFALAATPV